MNPSFLLFTKFYCIEFFFFFNDPATTEIYTLSLHDALPICRATGDVIVRQDAALFIDDHARPDPAPDRKSTRLNSSHANISYAVFCLKKKKKNSYSFYYNTNNDNILLLI